ncbi:MAG: glycerol kinase GlpK [Gemmatimonadota bacterium]
MTRILALDQGTTGSTALVIGERGDIVAKAYAEFSQHFPRPGWVEHDAAEIRDVTFRVAQEVLARAGVGTPDAVGITNQRETVVLWDRASGEPAARAIVWQDRRTAERCRELKEEGREPWVRERTGLVLDPYFSATKLAWMLDRDAGLRSRAEAGELAAGTIDTWLIWQLTGGEVHATDPTNASRTLLYDIHRGEWSDELLELFGVPRAVLSDVRPSSGEFGVVSGDAPAAGARIAGVAGDQQAALFGQGCWRPGSAKSTYGTGAFLLMHTGDNAVASQRGLLSTVACGVGGEATYALEGSIFIAGAAIQWLRDELGVIASAGETEALARSLDDNDGVYLVPAFVGLGAPHWEAEARGMVVGLTRGSRRAHLARAALEAMAYGTREVVEAMEADAGQRAPSLAVDGGATANDWFVDFLSGMLDRPVLRPPQIETTALGAAGLAGIGVGAWADGDDFLAARGPFDRFEGSLDEERRELYWSGWRRAVNAAVTWARS